MSPKPTNLPVSVCRAIGERPFSTSSKWSSLASVGSVVLLLFVLLSSCRADPEARPGAPLSPPGLDDRPSTNYAWVEMGPSGRVVARTTIPSSWRACPAIEIDGELRPMAARGAPPPGFEGILVCESSIPAGTSAASIGPQMLPLPKPNPRRIVVLGDTGCRIKGSDVQDCDNPQDWKFREVARDLASSAPDLVVHVGDYHYREGDGGQQLATCSETKIGLCWESWEADFFAPASTLLRVAPWIFVRGNHEDCGTQGSSSDPPRAWRGWLYLLDPRPLAADPWDQGACPAYTDPYLVAAGDLSLLVMDTSEIPDDFASTPEPETVERYAQELEAAHELVGERDRAWLVTHRPFWAVASWSSQGSVQIGSTDLTLQAAVDQSSGVPPAVDMLIAGHVHLFERLVFGDGRPPQLVFGGGGTKLDPEITDELLAAHPQVLASLGVARRDFETFRNVDYGIIDSQSEGWTVTVKNVEGTVDATFSIGSH